jgi:TRAP-type C4-dicarboxylate transport system permease small subunit
LSDLLDRTYRLAAVLAACCIGAICLLISAQVLLNAGTRMGLPLPPTIPSYADIAGYLLAAATFLALPWTLRSGGHVRVGLVTSRLPARAAFATEALVLAAATAFSGYATVYAALLLEESHRFGDVSTGIVAIPTWLVQIPMVAGLALLSLALFQSLIETWHARTPVLGGGEEA